MITETPKIEKRGPESTPGKPSYVEAYEQLAQYILDDEKHEGFHKCFTDDVEHILSDEKHHKILIPMQELDHKIEELAFLLQERLKSHDINTLQSLYSIFDNKNLYEEANDYYWSQVSKKQKGDALFNNETNIENGLVFAKALNTLGEKYREVVSQIIEHKTRQSHEIREAA